MKTQSCAVRVGYAAALLISTIHVGCVNVNTIPPEPSDSAVPGLHKIATMRDFEGLVLDMMTKMEKSVRFQQAICNAKEKKNGRRPCLVSGLLKNRISSRKFVSKLRAARDAINERLQNSDLFDLRTDENSIGIAINIFNAVTGVSNVPINGPEIDSLDFYLHGDLLVIPDYGENAYRLRITVSDLHTGLVAWEGTQKLCIMDNDK